MLYARGIERPAARPNPGLGISALEQRRSLRAGAPNLRSGHLPEACEVDHAILTEGIVGCPEPPRQDAHKLERKKWGLAD